jgi:hypothetical protein
MYKTISTAGLVAAVLMFSAVGAFAQSSNHGIWKPHYGSNGSSGRSYSSRGYNYSRPTYRYAPQPAIAAEPEYRSFSFEPLGIKASDMVVVARDSAPVMRGRTVLGAVARGTEFKVTKVVNGWLGAAMTLNGREVRGWIWNGNVRLASEAPPAGA